MNQRTDDAATVQITTLRVTGIRCAAYVGRMLEGISGVVHVDVHQRPSEIIVEHLPAFVDVERRVGDRMLAEDIVKVFAEQKGLSSSNAAVRVFRAREASGTP